SIFAIRISISSRSPIVLLPRDVTRTPHGLAAALRRIAAQPPRPGHETVFARRGTRVERPSSLEGGAEGDLSGTGRWQLTPEAETTRVRYDWTVVTTKPWMNVLAPLLQPAFRWNHNQVMSEGGRGLARHLGVHLLSHRGSAAAGCAVHGRARPTRRCQLRRHSRCPRRALATPGSSH